ncbi:beta-galactosidase [Kitasatospora indigofera]|uniref:beta-galactosidase n=1 Tax=Kitasatospora indigofera TaxID=67307 RepID=UPI0036BD5328
MHFGTSWYPEHWPAERWPRDLELMREAGMTVVRLGDFAWSRLEPEEGRFETDWLAEALDQLAGHGLSAVLATPTAGPPVWLTDRYPDTLIVDAQGRRSGHGNRAHGSPSSPRHREHCARIAGVLARRFGRHPAVIGWQIDNELNALSHDEDTRRQFAGWLKARYGTVEALNRAWHLAFWSQEYRDWSQLPIPVGVQHPSLTLAWRRFATTVFRDFVRCQADAIRAHARPGQWISHNVMTAQDDYDLAALAEDLDLVGLDYYVGRLDHPGAGAHHDVVRGLKRRPYWLMEAQPGSACWSQVNNALDRGEARRLAWTAVGHGADAVLFWQWRSSPGGQEQYHGTLVGPDGRPRPFYEEAAVIGRELAAAAPALAGTVPAPEVAVLQGYEDRWAVEAQRHHAGFDPTAYWTSFHRALRLRGLDVDVVVPSTPLDGYRVVVAPTLHLLDDGTGERLLDWVRRGGRLLLGVRTGMKDTENLLLPGRQPGPLAAAGVSVVEYYALPDPVPVAGELLGGRAGRARIWAEWLDPDPAAGARVLLRYGAAGGWLDGRPAVVEVPLGAGTVTYCGAWLDEDGTDAVVGRLLAGSGIRAPLDVPEDVELCRRVRPDGEQVLVLVSHARERRSVALPEPCTDVLTGVRHEDAVKIAGGDVVVLVPAGDGPRRA